MAWFVYIVVCSDNTYYTGICYNLRKRIADHNSGKYVGSFTRSRLPVKLVYWKKFENRFEAAKSEKVIKDYSKFKKEKLISSLHRILR